jgi:hypothetical protein
MQEETLVPLPEDADRIVCDFLGCGKMMSKTGMGRHRAIHKRAEPKSLADHIVERLRLRAKNHLALAANELENVKEANGEIGALAALSHLRKAQADLELLGAI